MAMESLLQCYNATTMAPSLRLCRLSPGNTGEESSAFIHLSGSFIYISYNLHKFCRCPARSISQILQPLTSIIPFAETAAKLSQPYMPMRPIDTGIRLQAPVTGRSKCCAKYFNMTISGTLHFLYTGATRPVLQKASFSPLLRIRATSTICPRRERLATVRHLLCLFAATVDIYLITVQMWALCVRLTDRVRSCLF